MHWLVSKAMKEASKVVVDSYISEAICNGMMMIRDLKVMQIKDPNNANKNAEKRAKNANKNANKLAFFGPDPL